MRVFSPAYIATLVVTVVTATSLCVAGRRFGGTAARPARWAVVADWTIAAALLATSGLWLATTLTTPPFTAANSLPFALCDVAALVAAAALLTRQRLLVEITYFWGLAGCLQSLLTPDLSFSWPSLQFVEYVVAHAAIVCAALFLVVGQRLEPGRGAVVRVWLVTLGYTVFVGAVDAATGGNYMYLRRVPATWTLLSVLGPWPWYIASAAVVAFVLFGLLDAPFHLHGRPRASAPPVGPWGDGTHRQSASNNPTGRTEARSRAAKQPERPREATNVRTTSSGTDPTPSR